MTRAHSENEKFKKTAAEHGLFRHEQNAPHSTGCKRKTLTVTLAIRDHYIQKWLDGLTNTVQRRLLNKIHEILRENQKMENIPNPNNPNGYHTE